MRRPQSWQVITLIFIIGFIFFIFLFLLTSEYGTRIPGFEYIKKLIKIKLFDLTPMQIFPIFILYTIIGTIIYLILILAYAPMEISTGKSEEASTRTVEVTEQFIEMYEIEPPYVYVGIAKKRDKLQYIVIEPILTEDEKALMKKIEDLLYEELKIDSAEIESKERAAEYLRDKIEEILAKFKWKVSRESLDKIIYYIIRDHIYYGKIEPLIRDVNVEDISCNGPNTPVYVYHRFYESIPTNIVYNEEELDRFIIRLAYTAGRHVSIDTPIVDATLPDGTRVHLNYGKEVSRTGSSFSIRKFRREPFTIVDLMNFETLDEELAAFLWFTVEYNASILVAGGTASGKTTLLNAISLFIRPDRKIVSIEDTAELNLPHENWNALIERTGFGVRGSEAEIRMFELLRAALRQRPDVIIVGEVRGEEAYTMFQAMASVSGDTPILIRDKYGGIRLVPIGEFIDHYYKSGEQWIKKYISGVEALTLDENYNITFRPIHYVLRHRTNKIYRIRYGEGGELEATGAHSIVSISSDGDIITKRVDELKKGDFLVTFIGSSIENDYVILDAKDILKGGCISKMLILEGEDKAGEAEVLLPRSSYGKYIPRYIKVDPDLAYTFGVYLANGSIKHGKDKSICFSIAENNMLNRITNTLKRFNATPRINSGEGCVIAEYNHTVLASLFEKLMGDKLESKHIPDFLWRAPVNIVKEFLNGYYTGHPTLDKGLINSIIWLSRLKGYRYMSGVKGKYLNANTYLDNVSKEEKNEGRMPIEPLRKLFKLLKPRSTPKKYTYILRKGGGTISKRMASEILSYIVNNRTKEFTEASQHLINNIRTLISSNLELAEVRDVKVEKVDKYVYDISIPETELFIGGNIPVILHNTGHGGLGSIHAESVKAVIDRLTSAPMNIPSTLIPTLNMIVLITRLRVGDRIIRKIIHIAEPYIDESTGELKLNEVYRWDAYAKKYIRGDKSLTIERISRLTGISPKAIEEDINRRKTIIRWMFKKGIKSFSEVSEIIRRFYMNPEEVYQAARLELIRMEAA